MGNIRRAVLEPKEPRVWTVGDFPDASPGAVAAGLSRLSRGGFLRRVRRGVYERLIDGRFGAKRADAASLAVAIGKRTGASMTLVGVDAWRALGLTTQMGAFPVYITDRWPKSIEEHGRTRVAFRRTMHPIAEALPATERAYIYALRNLNRIPGTDPDALVGRLVDLLKTGEADSDQLVHGVRGERPRARAAMGAIASAAGVPATKLKGLRESLNPLTRYSLPALRKLTSARDWGIVD